jgi:hypothetical protein
MAVVDGGTAVPDQGTSSTDRTRPLGVVVLSFLHVLMACFGLLALAGVSAFATSNLRALLLEKLGDLGWLYGGLMIVGIAIAFGLWSIRQWGWYGAMLWTGVGLVWQILLYLNGHQNYIYMLVYVVEAFYLNQREVKRVFRTERATAASVVLEQDRSGPA